MDALSTRKIWIDTGKSRLWTIDGFIGEEQADRWLGYFSHDDAPLIADPKTVLYGKECTMHRRVGFFSDESVGYKFARQEAVAVPTTSHIRNCLLKINSLCGTQFNGVLVNHYRSGEDYIGPHPDEEKSLAPSKANGIVLDGKIVAAISLGTERTFRVRNKTTKEIVMDIPTRHGQLLIMDGFFQEEFLHEIPPQKRIEGDRISLTARVHKVDH